MNTVESAPRMTEVVELDTNATENEFTPDMVFEMADTIARMEEQFGVEFNELARRLAENDVDPEKQETESLQDKYNLDFDPEVTLRGIGSFAMNGLVSGPEAAQHIIEIQAIEVIAEDEKKQETEPEDPEVEEPEEDKEPNYETFMSRAREIIDRLYAGDESKLRELPIGFQDALKLRMVQRIEETKSGEMTLDGMHEEIEGMYSVACVGLYNYEQGER